MKREELYRTSILIMLCFCFFIMNGNSCIAYGKTKQIHIQSGTIENKDGLLEEAFVPDSLEPWKPQEVYSNQGQVIELGPLSQEEVCLNDSESMSEKLSDQNLALYKVLKKQIRKVANGDKSKTSFSISASAILGKSTFTEKDLGVTIYDESKNDWGNESRIENAVYELTSYSLSKVLYSLMVDCPYELYWFDKTIGIFASKPGNYEISSQDGGILTITDPYTFRFAVSRAYAVTSGSKFTAGDVTYYLTTRTAKINAAKEANSQAKKLVKQCANLPDYEKLLAYSDYILESVSYNDDAVEDTDYGDPWQLIYVFDNNPKTNVVCEGYSKALQHLCNLTQWNSPYVNCRLASGMTYYKDSYGNHMWNIIHMPDSKDYRISGGTYLLDLTNSDQDSLGEDGSLFFAVKESGSVSSGYTFSTGEDTITYYYGSPTTSVYSSKQLKISSVPYQYQCINNHSLQKTQAIIATPGVDGTTESTYCSVCGWVKKKASVIPAPQTIQFSKDPAKYTYSGKVKHPSFTLLDNKGTTIDKSLYKISWPSKGDYTGPGSYKVKITFTKPKDWEDNAFYPYSGSMTASFKIIPQGTSFTKLTAGKSKVTLYWNKQKTQTTGYQIQRASNKSFNKNCKNYRIANKTVNNLTVDNLKTGKCYYFRIRTYTLINDKYYYSKWSSIQSKTVK